MTWMARFPEIKKKEEGKPLEHRERRDDCDPQSLV